MFMMRNQQDVLNEVCRETGFSETDDGWERHSCKEYGLTCIWFNCKPINVQDLM